jgi:hypothetical protein
VSTIDIVGLAKIGRLGLLVGFHFSVREAVALKGFGLFNLRRSSTPRSISGSA